MEDRAYIMRQGGRIYRALRRCSRDRWLSPEDVFNLGIAFAKCLDQNCFYSIFLNATQGALDVQDCGEVGLLRGKAPFTINTPGYGALRKALKTSRGKKAALLPELLILNLKIEEMTHGRKSASYIWRRAANDSQHNRRLAR